MMFQSCLEFAFIPQRLWEKTSENHTDNCLFLFTEKITLVV